MESSGPVVTVVILRADGTVEEMKLDATPKKRYDNSKMDQIE